MAKLAKPPATGRLGEDLSLGPYRFSISVFKWVQKLFESTSEAGAESYFIDELGKLELQIEGHANLNKKSLDSGMNIYISVQDVNIDDAVKTFGIGEYRLITVN